MKLITTQSSEAIAISGQAFRKGDAGARADAVRRGETSAVIPLGIRLVA